MTAVNVLNRYEKYIKKIEVEREYKRNNDTFKKKSHEYKCVFCDVQQPQKTGMLSHVDKEHKDKIDPLDQQPIPEETKDTAPEPKQIEKHELNFKQIDKTKENPIPAIPSEPTLPSNDEDWLDFFEW